jgi:hypothetical protein
MCQPHFDLRVVVVVMAMANFANFRRPSNLSATCHKSFQSQDTVDEIAVCDPIGLKTRHRARLFSNVQESSWCKVSAVSPTLHLQFRQLRVQIAVSSLNVNLVEFRLVFSGSQTHFILSSEIQSSYPGTNTPDIRDSSHFMQGPMNLADSTLVI